MKKYILAYVVAVFAIVAVTVVLAARSDSQTATLMPSNGRYVALGDSVAAGIGLADYSDSSACNRTQQAYPNAVAQKLNYRLESVACSGATTQRGLLGTQDVNRLAVAPQIDSLLAGAKPKLITMTIGANDADWTTYIQKCYTEVCGSEADTAQVNAGIGQAAANVASALTQIRDAYPNDPPKVVLTGYYRLFSSSPTANCTELTGIDQSELAWIARLQTDIDRALQATSAGYDFATFTPISFASHELCTDQPWIQGIGGKAPFHPTEAGQTAIADQVLRALDTAQ